MISFVLMRRNQRLISTTKERRTMQNTNLATELAAVASAARSCGDFGHGYQWRMRSAANPMNTNSFGTSINATATKRTARHLGMLTT